MIAAAVSFVSSFLSYDEISRFLRVCEHRREEDSAETVTLGL